MNNGRFAAEGREAAKGTPKIVVIDKNKNSRRANLNDRDFGSLAQEWQCIMHRKARLFWYPSSPP